MPKVRRGRRPPPAGWDKIEPKLEEFERRMREAENESHEGKRKVESVWPIHRINHERSRYIYELFYKKKEISRELYEYCLKGKHVDAGLIAKWKKSGYEKLCCLQCIQPRNHSFGGVCLCRVPKSKLSDPDQLVECQHCGCNGCASCD